MRLVLPSSFVVTSTLISFDVLATSSSRWSSNLFGGWPVRAWVTVICLFSAAICAALLLTSLTALEISLFTESPISDNVEANERNRLAMSCASPSTALRAEESSGEPASVDRLSKKLCMRGASPEVLSDSRLSICEIWPRWLVSSPMRWTGPS